MAVAHRHRAPAGSIERRLFVDAPPEAVFRALGDPARPGGSSLHLDGAGPDWPAAGASRPGRLPIGPLGVEARVVSLEARPGRRLRLGIRTRALTGEWQWSMEAAYGGTRVACVARVEPAGRLGGLAARLERRGLGSRLEDELADLKARAEAATARDRRRE
jgi:hypothetical protein